MKQMILPKISGLPIIEKYMPIGHPNRPGTKLTVAVWPAVGIHETANFNPGASDTMNVGYASRAWETGKYKSIDKATGKEAILTGPIEKGSKGKDGIGTAFRYGAAQIYIDADSVTLVIPLDEVAYHAGDRPLKYDPVYKGQKPLAKQLFNNKQNYMIPGVEMCDNKDWEKVQANTIEFLAQLIFVNKIPIPKWVRHFDLTGKPCPSRMLDDKVFSVFSTKIITRINQLKGAK